MLAIGEEHQRSPFSVGPDRIECLVEKNVLRRGLYSPGMHIPIAIEDELFHTPDIYYVLAWNFKKEILSKNPDVDSYVRRTGAELGIFATQTSRGDIQVVLRPAEDGLLKRVFKPMRPKMDDKIDNDKFEDLMKRWGKEAARKKYQDQFNQADDKTRERMIEEEGKAIVRRKYRRR